MSLYPRCTALLAAALLWAGAFPARVQAQLSALEPLH